MEPASVTTSSGGDCPSKTPVTSSPEPEETNLVDPKISEASKCLNGGVTMAHVTTGNGTEVGNSGELSATESLPVEQESRRSSLRSRQSSAVTSAGLDKAEKGNTPKPDDEVPLRTTRQGTLKRRNSARASPTSHNKEEEEDDIHPRTDSVVCEYCHQDESRCVMHPEEEDAVEESIAICHDALFVEEASSDDINEKPLMKLTGFMMRCPKGHLCSLDACSQSESDFYMSGYLKNILSDDPRIEGGVPVKKLGPVDEWYYSSYDGGTHTSVGISTESGEYCLMEPAEVYEPFMIPINNKLFLSKIVIEHLILEENQLTSYADLLSFLEGQVMLDGSSITEEELLNQAQFICEQYIGSVYELDGTYAELSPLERLEMYPCLKELIALARVTVPDKEVEEVKPKKRAKKAPVKKARKITLKEQHSKATTTPVVEDMFGNLFPQQINLNDDKVAKPSAPYLAKAKRVHLTAKNRVFTWGQRAGNARIFQGFYKEILGITLTRDGKCGGPAVFQVGDCVAVLSDPGKPLDIGCIMYMNVNAQGNQNVHVLKLRRASESFLGETADPSELFYQQKCLDVSPQRLAYKVQLEERHPDPEAWRLQGGGPVPPALKEDQFFLSMRYTEGELRLTTAPRLPKPDREQVHQCPVCQELQTAKDLQVPKLTKTETGEICSVNVNGLTVGIGSCVFLEAGTHRFKTKPADKKLANGGVKEKIDRVMYPEVYRKKQSGLDTLEEAHPFQVGRVVEILTVKDRAPSCAKEVRLTLAMFYRGEDTHAAADLAQQAKDRNLLYWGSEACRVTMDTIQGKCYVSLLSSLTVSPLEWSKGGPFRFYVSETYNPYNKKFEKLPANPSKLADPLKYQELETAVDHPAVTKPLRSLDIFAGCGGLTKGLEEAGVAETRWAVEKDPAAAEAFKLNFPNSAVLEGDVNELLAAAIARENGGEGSSGRSSSSACGLPRKGEVELLAGGPPCQGFSGMNRFSEGEYSVFKCSLMVTYMAYVEFYRPRHVILENVRTMATYKGGTLVKLLLACLLKMGYQCSVGVLQAGCYGVPQKRRRAIVLAAAPGEILPRYPEPQYAVGSRELQLTISFGGTRYESTLKWANVGAAMARIRVSDALSDLPPIENGELKVLRPYDSKPVTFYQRLLREGVSEKRLSDHVCKSMSPLNLARIQHVPKEVEADWRDLPNICINLKDGSRTVKLKYKEFKMSEEEETVRGVCPCVVRGAKCEAAYWQGNTLIPWCLPHTSERHNNWAGLYGRVDPNGVFSTTITNPEPMGKQGRVVHPTQDRLVSVRECARSQGFRDSFHFCGTVLQKHRQVGNAVPPPLAAAIGMELRRSLSARDAAKEDLLDR